MSVWSIISSIWLPTAFLMLVLWFIQKKTRDAGIVDAGWAFSLFFSAVFIYYVSPGEPTRKLFFLLLALIWSGRLGLYILMDRVLGGQKKEDGRYRYMREVFGANVNRVFFWFFQAQAIFVVIFSLPMLAVAFNSKPLGFSDIFGFSFGLVCVFGEFLADKQLSNFRSNPNNAGKTCRAGLWRYSRHPNYFFEWLLWFGYLFLSIGSPLILLAILGPIQVLFFLWKITGIPYTEKQALRSREDYKIYQETTSMFFPWFPKERK